MRGLTPTESAMLDLDLEPGRYYALCVIPDPVGGKPHLALGMGKEFTVH